jgi:hypothetical protein
MLKKKEIVCNLHSFVPSMEPEFTNVKEKLYISHHMYMSGFHIV